jgi:hypothetical protein
VERPQRRGGHDGADFAELDHAGALDGFHQDVRTTAGQSYTLTFDLRARPNVATSTQGVEVVWNGQVVATTTPGATWGSFSVPVTGTGGLDRLTIREVGGQAADGRGALLDNFSLVAASTPLAAQATPSGAVQRLEAGATLVEPRVDRLRSCSGLARRMRRACMT